MTIYRKVLCSERLPEKRGTYFTDKGLRKYCKSYGFYTDSIISTRHDLKTKYWLEEIELPSEEILEALDYNGGFKDGANYILNKLK